MSDSISLTVGGNKYSGWITATVRRSLFCASGSFELCISDQVQTEDYSQSIQAGESCTVMIGTQPMITGYIDCVSRSFNGSSRVTSISGRDKMMDVVDSSAIMKQKSWKQVRLMGLVSDILAEFDIKPILEASGNPIVPYHVLHEGSETVWEFIERASRLCGLICHSDGLGNLIITTPFKNQSKQPRVKLIQGKNILSAHAQTDLSARYSHYYVESTPYQKDDADSDASDILPLRTDPPIRDHDVPRYRPLMILAEALGTPTLLRKRGEWEKAVRRGRSEKVTVEVIGWKHGDQLWNINEWISLDSQWIGINNEFLVTEVAFEMGVTSGERTVLELQPASAFQPDETLRYQQLAKLHEEAISD